MKNTDDPGEVGIYKRYPPSENRLAEGGLRIAGHAKHDQADAPLVSIVTVVRDNVATLQRCIDSVQNQSYPNVEHIVIDGGSRDGTLEVIKANDAVLDYYISEPDSGIYAAMNKGVRLAHGRYLSMLNSDDWLLGDGTEKAVHALMSSGADISIGYANVINEAGVHFHTWKIGNFDDRLLISGMSFCHQAVFAHRNCFDALGLYDESLTFCGDYKWMKSAYLAGKRAVFIEEPIVNFSFTGLTVTQRPKWKAEAKKLLCTTFPFVAPEEADELLEYVYRDGRLTADLLPLIQRARGQEQFLVSIGMLLMARLVEAEARVAQLQAPNRSQNQEELRPLYRRMARKLKHALTRKT